MASKSSEDIKTILSQQEGEGKEKMRKVWGATNSPNPKSLKQNDWLNQRPKMEYFQLKSLQCFFHYIHPHNASIRSGPSLANKKPSPIPPPVTFIGVRLISLLRLVSHIPELPFHVPDLRRY
jgi:hypothetical protein